MSIIPGEKYGRLTAVAKHKESVKPHWVFKCDCGTEKAVAVRHVKLGVTRSCGCLAREMSSTRSRDLLSVHGAAVKGAETPEYKSWISMKKRCYQKTNSSYSRYGGKGITVCDEWKHDFGQFLHDMGPKPSKSHTIDRIDGDLGYFPGNCRWAGKKEQAANRKRPARKELSPFCVHGHQMTPENTYVSPKGLRRCRECKRIASRLWEISGDVEKGTAIVHSIRGAK